MNNYFVLKTNDDCHVVYQNHRDELISVAICADENEAQKHAQVLNSGQKKYKSNGNRYLRRYMR
jgi:hypothetical protein